MFEGNLTDESSESEPKGLIYNHGHVGHVYTSNREPAVSIQLFFFFLIATSTAVIFTSNEILGVFCFTKPVTVNVCKQCVHDLCEVLVLVSLAGT